MRVEYRTEGRQPRNVRGQTPAGCSRKARLQTGDGTEDTGQKAGKDISATTCLPKDMFPQNSLVVRIKGKIKKV